jgi:STE24 endopeptidase
VAGAQLSRAVEARADTFALELTDDPQALIAVQRRLAERNLADPDPPPVWHWLLGSHPSTVERIGAARAWEHGERP